jgi:hypothetical protein
LVGAECQDQCIKPSPEVLELFPLVSESMVLEGQREFRAGGLVVSCRHLSRLINALQTMGVEKRSRGTADSVTIAVTVRVRTRSSDNVNYIHIYHRQCGYTPQNDTARRGAGRVDDRDSVLQCGRVEQGSIQVDLADNLGA